VFIFCNFLVTSHAHSFFPSLCYSKGLGTIYLINTILAVLAAISAPSRKQPSFLWAAKTFAVGGIAYDQLMQIPTPEELVERARKEQEATQMRGRGRRGKNRQ
jgi:hypothetical protein